MDILEITESANAAARQFLSGKTQPQAREQIANALGFAWAQLAIGDNVPPAESQYAQFEAAFGIAAAQQIPLLPV